MPYTDCYEPPSVRSETLFTESRPQHSPHLPVADDRSASVCNSTRRLAQGRFYAYLKPVQVLQACTRTLPTICLTMLPRLPRARLAVLAALALRCTAATHREQKRASSGITSDPSSVNGQTYDYIVVGGGLTGTTVAARLAEDSTHTVLLIEAGGDDRTNPQVYDIYQYGAAFGGPLDWAWKADQGKIIRG